MPKIYTMNFTQFAKAYRSFGLTGSTEDLRQRAINGEFPFIRVEKKKNYTFDVNPAGFKIWIESREVDTDAEGWAIG